MFFLWLVLTLLSLFIFSKLKRKYIDAPQYEIPTPPILKKIDNPLPKDNKTCLITGAGGSVGRRLVEIILEKNLYNKVKILDVVKTWDPKDDRVEYIVGNICQSDVVNKAATGCGTIFHLASIIDLRNGYLHKAKMHNINVIGTYNVINASIMNGTLGLVYLSTIGHPRGTNQSPATEETTEYVTSPDFSLYLSTKWKAESAVLAMNGYGSLHTCALRSNVIWGFRDRFNYSPFLKSSTVVHYGDPILEYQDQPSIYMDSMCEALISAGVKSVNNPEVVGGKFYIISDIGCLRMCDLSLKISDALSFKISVYKITGIYRIFLIYFCKFLDWLTGGKKNWALLQFTESALKFAFTGFVVSSEKAQRELGHVPLTVNEALGRLKVLHEKEFGKSKKE